LRTITNASMPQTSRYVMIIIKRYSTIYYNRLIGHENGYVTELGNPLNVRRRLKRQWPSDLKDQREEEE
jgi:hypothetical protein